MAAERLHGDDTTVPVLAKGKTATGRIWIYVRDDRPFGGPAPPAALFYYSANRAGEHPRQHLANWSGILQADAYSGYAHLYETGRQPAPIIEAGCWSLRAEHFSCWPISRQAHGAGPTTTPPLREVPQHLRFGKVIVRTPLFRRLSRKCEQAPAQKGNHGVSACTADLRYEFTMKTYKQPQCQDVAGIGYYKDKNEPRRGAYVRSIGFEGPCPI
jgi:hypothetical protein